MKELSLHILDIAQNSVRAKADNVEIIINENEIGNSFEFEISDDGPGIPDEIVKTIKNPFTTSRTFRKVGLGIPLLNDTCKLCNGQLNIYTKKDEGTKIIAKMEYNHIDRPPLGDIVSTIVGLITSNDSINFQYSHSYNDNTFKLSTNEIKEVLDGVPLSNIDVIQWIKEFIKENIDAIK